MGIWYLILMGVVSLFAAYEVICFYREYTKTKERRDLRRFGMKIIVLAVLIVLFVWTINTIMGILPL